MWKKLTVFGMAAVLIYLAHVVLGGIMWEGYNHLMQPISDLTATGAPDAAILNVFTIAYGLFAIVFAISIFKYLKNVPKSAKIGMIVLLAMFLVSFSYNFFPQDLPGAPATFTGTAHIVVTALIVPLTILAPFFIGFGMRKLKGFEGFGKYSIITGIIILIAGGTSAMFFAKELPYFGLVERINIGALQLWIFLMSLKFFSKDFSPQDENLVSNGISVA